MARARTTVLTTDDRVSHAMTLDNAFAKHTACGRTFVAWIDQATRAKRGPWHGVEQPLPILRGARWIA